MIRENINESPYLNATNTTNNTETNGGHKMQLTLLELKPNAALATP